MLIKNCIKVSTCKYPKINFGILYHKSIIKTLLFIAFAPIERINKVNIYKRNIENIPK